MIYQHSHVDEEAEDKLAIKREPQPLDTEQEKQPKAKKSKLTAASEKLPEVHDIYELAASFGADVNEDSDSSEESSDELVPETDFH